MTTRDMQQVLGKPDIISKVRFEGIAPNVANVKVAIVVPEEVSVSLYGGLVCEVKVFSRMKRGHLFRGLFDISALGEEAAARKAGVTAGALTESLAASFPCNVDPGEAAREAYGAFKDALKRFQLKMPTPKPKDAALAYILEALKALEQ